VWLRARDREAFRTRWSPSTNNLNRRRMMVSTQERNLRRSANVPQFNVALGNLIPGRRPQEGAIFLALKVVPASGLPATCTICVPHALSYVSDGWRASMHIPLLSTGVLAKATARRKGERVMEHKPVLELQQIADLDFGFTLSDRDQRLARWSKLLLANPDRLLRSLHEIEHLSASDRRTCRSDDSPLSVAYHDPILRSSGLKSDSVGDCTDFFGLTDEQMHHAFCSCHTGAKLTGAESAARLRAVVEHNSIRNSSGLWQTLLRFVRAAP
jgi:hypothetical protein